MDRGKVMVGVSITAGLLIPLALLWPVLFKQEPRRQKPSAPDVALATQILRVEPEQRWTPPKSKHSSKERAYRRRRNVRSLPSRMASRETRRLALTAQAAAETVG